MTAGSTAVFSFVPKAARAPMPQRKEKVSLSRTALAVRARA